MSLKNITKESFEKDVLQAERPVILEFWAPWCTYCRRLSPVLDRLAPQLEGKADICKVNVDEQPELEERLEVSVIPTLFLYKNGEHGEKLVAPGSQEEILRWMEEQ